MKLYELTGQYLALQEMVAGDEQEHEAIQNTLQGLEGDIQTKAEGVLRIAATLEANTGAIGEEIARLSARKKTMESRAQWLRDYLKQNMEATGIRQIACPLFTITLIQGREVAVVENESLLPSEFVRTVVSTAPVKADILKALKAGAEVPGAEVPGARLARGESYVKVT